MNFLNSLSHPENLTVVYFFASTKLQFIFKFGLYINSYILGLVVYILKMENGINTNGIKLFEERKITCD